ncbi:glycosyltransferase [Herbiconiux moechotypicola]|uniref:4,4'-diaponeurosporenoate glycosyltransferase n=1 Tax=Herbiconiux moechotypicola TaxID=637393 RepID=A0ABN3DMA4_9MICO|nr:glycosyltransferase [Herbiconiux moechotypicola]MCS5730234.1 glycosyltransferase [Herbiconiux moechotypicola]
MIERIDVVVPARDEEDLLAGCIDALVAARDELLSAHPSVGCRVLVVLDGCSDGSADIARAASARDAGIEWIEVPFGNVGMARGAGVERLLDPGDPPSPSPGRATGATIGGVRHDRHWLCTTDADSRVPRDWLLTHLAAARSGAWLALGRVHPAADESSPGSGTHEAWHRAHADPHARHVFGANLGVRADAYLSAGGFPRLRTSEDVGLYRAVLALGDLLPDAAGHIVDLQSGVVETSARRVGRAPDGFAAYLRALP